MTNLTTPAKKNRHVRREPRRTVLTVLVVGVLIALLAPAGYLFTRLWSQTGGQLHAVDTERAGVGYAGPLAKLLGALLDAQETAVSGNAVDDTGIRGAVDDVNTADRQYGDPLGVRQRWAQLSHEIDTVLGRKPTGGDAIGGYATPIGLTQALLGKISDDVKVTPDFGPGGYHLIETAMEYLPEVTVNAGQLAALAHVVDFSVPAATGTRARTAQLDPRLTVAQDRVARAAEDVNVGLRTGGDPTSSFPVDLNMLGPLDEFAAAVDALNQTAAALGNATGTARSQLDGANDRVQKAVLTLESAILQAFDNQLGTRASGYDGQRQGLVLAGVVIALAAVALLALRVPRSGAAVPEPVEEPEPPAAYPPMEQHVPAPARPLIPDVVDARELLTPELVQAGRGLRPRKRRDGDDPR